MRAPKSPKRPKVEGWIKCETCRHRCVCRYEEDHKKAYDVLYNTFHCSTEGVFKRIADSPTVELIIKCTAYSPENSWCPEQKQPMEINFDEGVRALKKALEARDLQHDGDINRSIDDLKQLYWEANNKEDTPQ